MGYLAASMEWLSKLCHEANRRAICEPEQLPKQKGSDAVNSEGADNLLQAECGGHQGMQDANGPTGTVDLPDMTKPIVINIEKNPNLGQMPAIVELGHRQLEKTNPPPTRQLGNVLTTYQVPVDLLAKLIPSSLAEEIETLEFTYKRVTPTKS